MLQQVESAEAWDRQRRREALIAAGSHELAEHLRDGAAHGGVYVVEYAAYLTSPKRRMAPHPRGIHPLIARLVREIMLDAEVGQRRSR